MKLYCITLQYVVLVSNVDSIRCITASFELRFFTLSYKMILCYIIFYYIRLHKLSYNIKVNFFVLYYGTSGWRSGKNTRLSPMRLGFDSRSGKYVSWVCGPSPTSGVFSGYSGFLPQRKPLITPTSEQFRD